MTETVQISHSDLSTQKKSSPLKEIFSKFLKANPIDPLAVEVRKQMKNLGLLEIVDESWYWLMGFVPMRATFKLLWQYKSKGYSNMPEYGPVVVVANHQCEFDPYLVGCAVPRKVQWLSKAENFDYPFYRTFIEPFGTIPLHRGQHDEEAMAKVRAVLSAGGCVGIFPEGTRSSDGSISEFRSGAARICLEMGVPFLPVAILGAYKILPKTKNFLHTKIGVPVEARVGKPVYPDPNLKPTLENIKAFAKEMRKHVVALYEGKTAPQMKVEYNPADPEHPQIMNVEKDQYAEIAQDLSIA
jgi:1-acyl-sn-glycerol-3-phosphate acyltransferase